MSSFYVWFISTTLTSYGTGFDTGFNYIPFYISPKRAFLSFAGFCYPYYYYNPGALRGAGGGGGGRPLGGGGGGGGGGRPFVGGGGGGGGGGGA